MSAEIKFQSSIAVPPGAIRVDTLVEILRSKPLVTIRRSVSDGDYSIRESSNVPPGMSAHGQPGPHCARRGSPQRHARLHIYGIERLP